MMALIRLCRLYYVVPMALTYLLTVIYGVGGPMGGQWPAAVFSTLAVGLMIAGGYVFNDVFDVKADEINSPSRPIVAGSITKKYAACWGGGLIGAGLLIAFFCRWPFFLALTGVSTLLFFYDAMSKRLGIAKPILVAALMTSIYLLALTQTGGFRGSRAESLWFFPIWMFFSTLAYQILKDIRDIRGDCSLLGRAGLIQRHPKVWLRIAKILTVAGSLVLVFPYFVGCHGVYLLIISGAILAAVASVFLPVRKAMILIYVEFFIVGIAATADLVIHGF